MTQQRFRGVLTAAIAVVLVAGLWFGWHATHHAESSCTWRGQRIHGTLCP